MLHHAEDGGEVMTPFQHASCLAGHRIESLPVREARILLDLKQGPFRRPPENRKYRPVFQKIQRVIPPFTCCHHPAVKRHQFPNFMAVKRDLRRRGGTRLAYLCRFEGHNQRLVRGSGIFCHSVNQLRKFDDKSVTISEKIKPLYPSVVCFIAVHLRQIKMS